MMSKNKRDEIFNVEDCSSFCVEGATPLDNAVNQSRGFVMTQPRIQLLSAAISFW